MATSYWQPDGEVSSCPSCDATFALLTRKHHCRHCGLVYCDGCAPVRDGGSADGRFAPGTRVCDQCWAPTGGGGGGSGERGSSERWLPDAGGSPVEIGRAHV